MQSSSHSHGQHLHRSLQQQPADDPRIPMELQQPLLIPGAGWQSLPDSPIIYPLVENAPLSQK